MVRWLAVIAAGGALLIGCGKVSDSHDGAASGGGGNGAAGEAGASGSASTDNGAAGSKSCAPGLASEAEIAATPRADSNLELLALQLSSGHLTADPAIYTRVTRDVTAIRLANPSLADIDYWANTDGRSIYLAGIDPTTFGEMQAGTYHAWDCLNQTYVKTKLQLGDGTFNDATLTLKGIYALQQLATEYSKLPGIKGASEAFGGGDGPTICVTPSADVWHYVFDRAGGDCPAGCTSHEYHHFSTTLAGDVTSLGDLTPAEAGLYASRKACRGPE